MENEGKETRLASRQVQPTANNKVAEDKTSGGEQTRNRKFDEENRMSSVLSPYILPASCTSTIVSEHGLE